MRVWYITMTFPAPSETFACNDVRTLRRAGVCVSVHALRCAHKASERLLRERSLDGLDLTHSSRSAIFRGLGVGLRRPKLLVGLLRWILSHSWKKPRHLMASLMLVPRSLDLFAGLEYERPDVVHIYWGHYPSLVGYLVLEHLPDVKVSVSLGAYDLEKRYGGSGEVGRRAHFVRTLAQVNVERIGDYFDIPSDRITVIHDGIDLQRLHSNGSAIAPEAPTGSTKPATGKVAKRIVTAGRLTVRKGMIDVLSVFKNVFEQHPDASLVFLGEGPERQRLQELSERWGLSEAVTFLGHVSHDRVFGELAKAEVFLFLSKGTGERLPNVVKEAMANQCVCVASNTTGMRELIPNDGYGFVVPIGSIEDATRRVLCALETPGLMDSVGRTAREHINSHFDLNEAVQQYICAWEREVPIGESPHNY